MPERREDGAELSILEQVNGVDRGEGIHDDDKEARLKAAGELDRQHIARLFSRFRYEISA